jgi:Fe2+ or Zn2+ uptake regulation protein
MQWTIFQSTGTLHENIIQSTKTYCSTYSNSRNNDAFFHFVIICLYCRHIGDFKVDKGCDKKTPTWRLLAIVQGFIVYK